MKIDIGCGMRKHPGYVRIDKDPSVEPNYILDLELDLLPFRDGSAKEILAENFLEHVKNIDHVFEEVWRVLEGGGLFKILVPHYQSYMAYFDPDHIRFFTEKSFIFWCRDTKGSDGRRVVRGKMDFKVEKVKTLIEETALKKFPNALDGNSISRHYWNVAAFIEAELTAVKPARVFVDEV